MTTLDRMLVCLETGLSLPVLSRWDNGKPIREANKRTIEAAVKKLGNKLQSSRNYQGDQAGARQ